MKKVLSLLIIAILETSTLFACTSIIVAGKATSDGRPVMFKNRDTDCLNNRVERYQGKQYAFIGLVNQACKKGEVWTGINEAGFCIMNTASYNIKDDKISYNKMDKEGVLMFEALGVCATVEDFRAFLKKHKKPLLVEANFGVIDAKGGASYFEVNNYEWWEYDVNKEPAGYRVVTNFSFAGRPAENQGVERYNTAVSIMRDYERGHSLGEYELKHDFFINHFSRSYRHVLLGTPDDYCPASGVAADQDFIPRRITSAAIAIEGVRPNEDPGKTVMWTSLGYPATSPMVPLLVGKTDILPDYVKSNGSKGRHALITDYSNSIKSTYVFPDMVSNGKRYVHLDVIQKGTEGRPSLITCAKTTEQTINQSFTAIYLPWLDGKISDAQFYEAYRSQQAEYWRAYVNAYAGYKL